MGDGIPWGARNFEQLGDQVRQMIVGMSPKHELRWLLASSEFSRMAHGPWSKQLSRKADRGFPGATIAFYGPDSRRATKVVVGIFASPHAKVTHLRKWFNDELDVRVDRKVGQEVQKHLREHGVRSIAMRLEIFGCPHEEGIDYPEGEVCPLCPYWAVHDRFSGERFE